MPQQDETATQEPKTGNVKQLTDEKKGLKRRVGMLEGRSNDVSDKYQRLEEGDKNKELNKKLEDGDKLKEKEIMERLRVVEGRSRDKFNFAKRPHYPRFNTHGRKTFEVIKERKKDWERKTVEVIKERLEDWKRKREVWLKNRDDSLYKLLNWWEGKQYENVEVFKLDVKEWRDVLYNCLVIGVEVYDSFIECNQFLVSLDLRLFDRIIGFIYFYWWSKDELYSQNDDYKQQQADVKLKIERRIESVDQIISDEGKDNNSSNNNNEFYIFGYKVDLTSFKTNLVRIFKHLK